MTKARLLLVVPESSGMTASRRTEYQAVADKIGAELLVTSMGCETQLLQVPLLTDAVPAASSPAPFRELAGGIAYSPEVIAAFRLLEPLLNSGDVKLVYDRWAQENLRFMAPNSTQPSALLPKKLGCFTLVKSAFTDEVEPSNFGRALRYALPLSLLGWGALGGLAWLVRHLFV